MGWESEGKFVEQFLKHHASLPPSTLPSTTILVDPWCHRESAPCAYKQHRAVPGANIRVNWTIFRVKLWNINWLAGLQAQEHGPTRSEKHDKARQCNEKEAFEQRNRTMQWKRHHDTEDVNFPNDYKYFLSTVRILICLPSECWTSIGASTRSPNKHSWTLWIPQIWWKWHMACKSKLQGLTSELRMTVATQTPSKH